MTLLHHSYSTNGVRPSLPFISLILSSMCENYLNKIVPILYRRWPSESGSGSS